ncbi:ABC transporter permease [Allosphingosinicella sp.]|jgi:ABC-type transport system involved in multi-copper enzyme maturation permease subunit|uniref:ABC transporter permease n=1 Tax=Allosphingosinicella sp. TaxID=2823234 RepID=UPI002EE5EC44
MISVLSAEATKLLRHRATWFLVWIYPLGMIAVFFIALMLDFFGAGEAPSEPQTAEGWVRDSAVIWQLATSNFGRFLIAAYAAVAIAGEYGWNTWKLIVPHRARRALLGSKLITVFALLYLGLGLAGLLTAGLSWVQDRLTGDSIPDGVTLAAVLEMQGLAALATLLPMLFTLAYAALAAVLTRSMVATLVIAIVVGTAEQLFTAYAGIFYPSAPGLISALYHFLPGYHLANLIEWIVEGQGMDVALPGGGGPLGWQASLAVAGGWAAGLIALTLWRFQRQDIN